MDRYCRTREYGWFGWAEGGSGDKELGEGATKKKARWCGGDVGGGGADEVVTKWPYTVLYAKKDNSFHEAHPLHTWARLATLARTAGRVKKTVWADILEYDERVCVCVCAEEV